MTNSKIAIFFQKLKKSCNNFFEINNLILTVYFLLIFEGVLRKWIFPSLSRPLFFVRDPFVLMIYFLALKQKSILKKFSPVIYMGIFIGTISLGLGLVQLLNYEYPILLLAYGWRNYFFLIPLAGIIENILTEKTFTRILKYTTLLIIPSFFLCYLQSISSAYSVINAGFGRGTNFFRSFSAGNYIRPAGFFTSSFGQSLFLTSITAFLLIIFLKWKTSRINLKSSNFYWCIAFTIFTTAISGQRGTIFNVMVVCMGTFFICFFLPPKSIKHIIKPLLKHVFFAALLLLGCSLLFSDHLNGLKRRFIRDEFTLANDPQAVVWEYVRRLSSNARLFRGWLDKTPFLGAGIGSSGNAAASINPRLVRTEDEWSRHIIELGPIFGVLFICYRILLAIFLFIASLIHARKYSNPTPFILLSFIGLIIFYGQLTGNGLGCGYSWFFIGLILNRIKVGQKQIASCNIPEESFL